MPPPSGLTMENVANQSLVYEVRLLCGPFDGLVSEVHERSLFDRRILTLPARPLDPNDGIAGLVEMGANRSIYSIVDRHKRDDPAGQTIALTYAFSGFIVPRHRRTNLLAHLLHTTGRRLGRWMLAPVDYPLNCRNLL